MNSELMNTVELKPADDTAFLEQFVEEQAEDFKASNDFEKCFDECGQVVFENITEQDLQDNNFLYEYILQLPDEIEIENYITKLRAVAKNYKLAGDFDRKVKPYRKKALNSLKLAEKQKRIDEYNKRAEQFPEWWDGDTLDEDVFCKCLLEKRELRCINGFLFDINGMIEESEVENKIYNQVKYYCKKSIGDKVKAIVRTLKVKCYSPDFIDDINTIHLQNGTLNTDGSFTSEKHFCRNRLNIKYLQEYKEPETWIRFVNELLEPDDVLTLQEFMGYCFIPCTKGQLMLFITGNGGEGKSRIGLVMQGILGEKSYSSLKLKALTGDKFSAESIDNKLLCVDDDLSSDKLPDTSKLKEIITAEGLFHINPKGRTPYETRLFVRLMAFGNNCVTALHDHSDGFYRRQLILKAKQKPENRVKDGFLIEKLLKEKDYIFLWAFKGLQRLIANNFNFTVSEQARQNLEANKLESCTALAFLESKDNSYFAFDESSEITTSALYKHYKSWCDENALTFIHQNTFSNILKTNAEKYNIQYKDSVYFTGYKGERKHARGFKGIKDLHPYKTTNDLFNTA